jgi:hypothetical protein
MRFEIHWTLPDREKETAMPIRDDGPPEHDDVNRQAVARAIMARAPVGAAPRIDQRRETNPMRPRYGVPTNERQRPDITAAEIQEAMARLEAWYAEARRITLDPAHAQEVARQELAREATRRR